MPNKGAAVEICNMSVQDDSIIMGGIGGSGAPFCESAFFLYDNTSPCKIIIEVNWLSFEACFKRVFNRCILQAKPLYFLSALKVHLP